MIILDGLPIWAVYLVTVILVLMAAEIGFRIGIWLQDRDSNSADARITGNVVDEANAIGTAWLRAGFLSEPDRSSSRALLLEYTRARLAAAQDATQLPAAIARTEQIHSELWSIVEKNEPKPTSWGSLLNRSTM